MNFHTEYHNQRTKYAEELFDKKNSLPHRYVLILTNKCNLACSFCFQERKGRSDAMTTNDWLAVIEQLPTYAHVTLTGGEPLVFKDFKEIFINVNKKFTTNVISNGLLITEDIINLFTQTKNFQVLSISIDDIGNIARDVKPVHWTQMIKNIDLLKKNILKNNSKMLLDAKTVVTDQNAKDLFEIYKFLVEKIEVNTHSFQILKGSPIQHADLMFPYDDIHNAFQAYKYEKFDIIIEQFEKVRKYNLDKKKYSYIHPKWIDLNSNKTVYEQDYQLLNSSNHQSVNFKLCKAPWESVHINVDGNLFPCLAVKIGNIKEKKLYEIINGNEFQKFKKDLIENSTFGACNRCGYLQLKT
jgi:MoaA/NifB/PqqE/SkfB family radical SAM enzyme